MSRAWMRLICACRVGMDCLRVCTTRFLDVREHLTLHPECLPVCRGPGLELAPLAEHCHDLDPDYTIPDPDPALLRQALTLAPGSFALQGADLGLPVANGIGKIGPAVTEATGGMSAGVSKRPLKKKKKRAEQSGSQVAS